MIASIRVLNEGNFDYLCELDIMKHSQEQIVARLKELGIDKGNVFVCGITDWEVDKIMSLDEVYLLKKVVHDLYDGDDYVVRFQLQRYVPIKKIISTYYQFCSKDEVATVIQLSKNLDIGLLINYFFKCGNWVTAFQGFVEQGEVLNTPKGFYRKVSFE